MLKVISINPTYGIGELLLTVDDINITIDNMSLTVDQLSIYDEENDIYDFIIPFRFFDSDVKMIMINELTNNQTIIVTTSEDQENGSMKIRFSFDFKIGENYEVSVNRLSDNKLMWRGKIYSTDQTDLQNFDLNNPVNGITKI